MRVYRIEWKDGIGPYRSSGRTGEVCDFAYTLRQRHNGDPDRPSPSVDGLVCPFWNEYHFGFRSLASFRRWFAGLLVELEQLEYKLLVYEVPKGFVEQGKKQLAFNKDKATKVAEFVPTVKRVKAPA